MHKHWSEGLPNRIFHPCAWWEVGREAARNSSAAADLERRGVEQSIFWWSNTAKYVLCGNIAYSQNIYIYIYIIFWQVQELCDSEITLLDTFSDPKFIFKGDAKYLHYKALHTTLEVSHNLWGPQLVRSSHDGKAPFDNKSGFWQTHTTPICLFIFFRNAGDGLPQCGKSKKRLEIKYTY